MAKTKTRSGRTVTDPSVLQQHVDNIMGHPSRAHKKYKTYKPRCEECGVCVGWTRLIRLTAAGKPVLCVPHANWTHA